MYKTEGKQPFKVSRPCNLRKVKERVGETGNGSSFQGRISQNMKNTSNTRKSKVTETKLKPPWKKGCCWGESERLVKIGFKYSFETTFEHIS